MSEIAVRHTREECFAHTNDWKKPYDGSIFDMFKDGSFELIDLSNPFGRGNPLWPSNGDFHIDRVQHMPMHYRLLQTFNDFHMHNSTHADSPSHVIPESPFTHELPIQNYFGEAVCLDIPKKKWELIRSCSIQAAIPSAVASFAVAKTGMPSVSAVFVVTAPIEITFTGSGKFVPYICMKACTAEELENTR